MSTTPSAATKLTSLAEAPALVADRDHITIGGVMLHRIPPAFVREPARQGRRALRLSKPSRLRVLRALLPDGDADGALAPRTSCPPDEREHLAPPAMQPDG